MHMNVEFYSQTIIQRSKENEDVFWKIKPECLSHAEPSERIIKEWTLEKLNVTERYEVFFKKKRWKMISHMYTYIRIDFVRINAINAVTVKAIWN